MARAWIALCRGQATFSAGRDDLGLAELQRAEELFSAPENRGMQRELSICRATIKGALHVHAGTTAAGEYSMRSIQLADAAGDLFGRMMMRCFVGQGLCGPFGAQRARAEIRLGLELALATDVSSYWNNIQGLGLHSLAVVEMLGGNAEQALAVLEQIGKPFDREMSWWWGPAAIGELACIWLFAVSRGVGDRASLLAQVERSAALLAGTTTPSGEPITYPVLAGFAEFLYGQLHAATGEREQARTLFESAAEAARESSSVAHRHYCLARLGDLIGGDRGAALRAEAEAALSVLGCTPGWIVAYTVRFED